MNIPHNSRTNKMRRIKEARGGQGRITTQEERQHPPALQKIFKSFEMMGEA
jgi:hypothetical protein